MKIPSGGSLPIGMHDSVFGTTSDPVAATPKPAPTSPDGIDGKKAELAEPPAASETKSDGLIHGRGRVGAILLSKAAASTGLATSSKSLTQTLDTLWERRFDVAMQPHPGSAIRIVSGNAAERPASVKPDTYLKGLVALAMGRPDGATTHTKRHSDIGTLRTAIRSAVRGETRWPTLARDSIIFDRAGTDPKGASEQIFIHASPEHVAALAEKLVCKVLDKPGAFPGVSRCKVAGPYKSGRDDTIVISTNGGDDTARVLAFLGQLNDSNPTWFCDSALPLTAPVLPGVSVGDMPASKRYAGQSFNGVRTQVLHSIATEATKNNLDRVAFDTLAKERWAEAGLDIEQPHRHTPDVEQVESTVVALAGSVAPTAGTRAVTVAGFDGKTQHEIELVLPKEVGDRLARRKNVRFVPSEGLFVKVDVDRTRNPPRERIVRQSAVSFVDDTRYRIDFGKMPPPFVSFDAKTNTYNVPKKVTMAVPPAGSYGIYKFTPELDPERAAVPVPDPLTLVRKLNDGKVSGEALAKVMSKIESYVADPSASTSQRVVLEEGTNGVSVVSLTNKAVGVWKPTAAEYPEQTRLNLEPDHQARREAFAYFLSKNLGHLGRVPPTIYREIDGEAGVISALSRGTLPGTHSPMLGDVLANPKDPIYQELAVFDCIIGNLDRHSGNLLIGDGAALAIDHGMAFPLDHGDQGEMNFLFAAQVELTPVQSEAIASLLKRKDEVREEADRLQIAPVAVDRMFERMERMVATGVADESWRTNPPQQAGAAAS